jgi:hypothetical protein
LSIVTPLVKTSKLPSSILANSNIFNDTVMEILLYINNGRLEASESLLLWLFMVVADISARCLEPGNLNLETLDETYTTHELLYDTYRKIQGCADYAIKAQHAMFLFCMSCYVLLKRKFETGADQNVTDVIVEFWKQRLENLRAKDHIGGQYLGEYSTSLGTKLQEFGEKYSTVLNSIHTDPGSPDIKNDRNLLAEAVDIGHPEPVAELLRRGANHGTTDDYGKTAIHIASEKGHIVVLHMLLLKVTSVELIDALGPGDRSALDMSIERKDRAAVALLVYHGAETKSKGSTGYTTFHRAAEYGNDKIAWILAHQGANKGTG